MNPDKHPRILSDFFFLSTHLVLTFFSFPAGFLLRWRTCQHQYNSVTKAVWTWNVLYHKHTSTSWKAHGRSCCNCLVCWKNFFLPLTTCEVVQLVALTVIVEVWDWTWLAGREHVWKDCKKYLCVTELWIHLFKNCTAENVMASIEWSKTKNN